jgi:hypothetical protein
LKKLQRCIEVKIFDIKIVLRDDGLNATIEAYNGHENDLGNRPQWIRHSYFHHQKFQSKAGFAVKSRQV